MLIFKLLLGLAVTIAVLYGLYRMQRQLRGNSGGGLVSAGIRRSRGERAEDLERFITDFRAQQGPALARQLIDAMPDHHLGVESPPSAAVAALEGPERLLYLLFKTSLPDHHLLPKARLGDFVRDAPSSLAAHTFTCLVCNRAFAPVCAVGIGPAPQAVEKLLRDIGVRSLSIDTTAMPRREQVRALVLG